MTANKLISALVLEPEETIALVVAFVLDEGVTEARAEVTPELEIAEVEVALIPDV